MRVFKKYNFNMIFNLFSSILNLSNYFYVILTNGYERIFFYACKDMIILLHQIF